MSAKSQFLKKLQTRQSALVTSAGKSQADIAEFRLRMGQLHEQMCEWLMGTGLNVEMLAASVTDLLVDEGRFDISGIVLRYNDRIITFMPLFLYGQGVTGCAEITLHACEGVTTLGRLFMRAGHVNDWTFTPPGALSRPGQLFDESAFFSLILALLP